MWNLISPRWAAIFMIAILLVVYCLWPLVIHFGFHADFYFLKLAKISIVASCVIAVGALLPIFDRQFRSTAFRLSIPAPLFHGGLWAAFIIFFIVTVTTADSIPFISALTGASENELSAQRGEFLIARQGWEASLVYIGTALTSALLPYSFAQLILNKSNWRVPAGLTLLAFMESFLVKAMFLQLAIPLIYLSATRRKWTAFAFVVIGSVGLLFLNTYIQKAGIDLRTVTPVMGKISTPHHQSPPLASQPDLSASGPYFTARYIPRSAGDHMIWRMIAIPTITAADALRVFDERFDHQYFLGATSTAVATLLRLPRINFDSQVFAYQWGESAFGRSNSTYLTEAYINFGWIGVIAFSLFVGQSLRWFYLSNDEAFKALWLVYVYFLAQGSLFGTLFSNGFLVIFGIGLFAAIKHSNE